ncbi:MAG TPA: hypothetical protein VHJ34_15395 [Actinomycetota bacterium]|nr:hypothetical protein [Actinomycetota bacterium]
MSAIGYCTTCSRAVHVSNADEPYCPVCSSALLMDEVPEPVAHRVGRNEAVIRRLNEDVVRAQRPDDPLEIACECGNADCTAHLRVPAAVYAEVRASRARFLLLPGHQLAGAEVVIGRGDGYAVVEKRGPGRTVAVESDPRG